MHTLLLTLGVTTAAHAEDLALIDEGWHLLKHDDTAGAARLGADLLRADATSGGAHQLYLAATTYADFHGPPEAHVWEYRAWWLDARGDPVRSTALAYGLIRITPEDDASICEELDALLSPVTQNPEHAWYQGLARAQAHERCAWDVEPIHEALAGLAGLVPAADGWAYGYRFARGDASRELVSAWEAAVRRRPTAVAQADQLWTVSDPSHDVLRARKLATTHALRLARSDVPATQHAAMRVLRAAEHPEFAEVEDRHEALMSPRLPGDPVLAQIDAVDALPSFEARLDALEALEPEVPPSGELRARLEAERAWIHNGRGDLASEFAARKRAWQADPTADRADGYAWASARLETDQEAALATLTDAIATLRQQHLPPDGTPWKVWREEHNAALCEALDTQALLLFQLGRYAEAAAAAQEVLDRTTSFWWDARIRMVAILEALGLKQDALVLLRDNLDGELTEGTALRAQYERLAKEDSLGWLPVETRVGALGLPMRRGEVGEDPRLGARFALEEVYVDGAKTPLDAFAGPLIVDMWATWCGPCINAMPSLKALADRYADKGLRVLGVSLDDNEAVLRRFLAGTTDVPWTIAWYGRDGFRDAGIDGIPALFILNRAHEVVYVGHGRVEAGDVEVEEAIRRALE
jgi:thiol-disulfide isomerase/thioredoxin